MPISLPLKRIRERETPEEAELSGFKKVRGDVTFESGILAVTGTETHSVALWGNPGVADFEAEISFRCQLENNSNLGIMLRAEDYSYFSSQPTQSWRGYYLQLGQHIVALSRYDYGEDTMDAFRLDGELSDGGEHTLFIRVESNRFTIVLDDKYRLETSDDCAFMSGQLGVFASAGKIEITKFSYRAL